jgi:hypothetical protein
MVAEWELDESGMIRLPALIGFQTAIAAVIQVMC